MTIKKVGSKGTVYSGARDGYGETGGRRGRRKKPVRRFSDLLEKEPEMKEGPVRLVRLPLNWWIEKDYGLRKIIFKDRKFWKELKDGSGYERADRGEVMRFKKDIAEAARTDKEIARIVSSVPELQE